MRTLGGFRNSAQVLLIDLKTVEALSLVSDGLLLMPLVGYSEPLRSASSSLFNLCFASDGKVI